MASKANHTFNPFSFPQEQERGRIDRVVSLSMPHQRLAGKQRNAPSHAQNQFAALDRTTTKKEKKTDEASEAETTAASSKTKGKAAKHFDCNSGGKKMGGKSGKEKQQSFQSYEAKSYGGSLTHASSLRASVLAFFAENTNRWIQAPPNLVETVLEAVSCRQYKWVFSPEPDSKDFLISLVDAAAPQPATCDSADAWNPKPFCKSDYCDKSSSDFNWSLLGKDDVEQQRELYKRHSEFPPWQVRVQLKMNLDSNGWFDIILPSRHFSAGEERVVAASRRSAHVDERNRDRFEADVFDRFFYLLRIWSSQHIESKNNNLCENQSNVRPCPIAIVNSRALEDKMLIGNWFFEFPEFAAQDVEGSNNPVVRVSCTQQDHQYLIASPAQLVYVPCGRYAAILYDSVAESAAEADATTEQKLQLLARTRSISRSNDKKPLDSAYPHINLKYGEENCDIHGEFFVAHQETGVSSDTDPLRLCPSLAHPDLKGALRKSLPVDRSTEIDPVARKVEFKN